ncbi:hypothetical protein [Bacillus taeanensis]|uniref:Uncharacterized protein n=1 Tax=Bacillus taeanensis TaxID=273032 RepID=A0A366XUI2_9BACI|nr:hypothetical protein [Bacillus taeanensis]RBW68429.1 hypothetical protein DS031_16565 [Bacillus taeanensis]
MLQTYQTKLKDLQLTKSQSAYEYLNAFGEQFGVFERKLFVLLYIHHSPPNTVKTSFTKQYGLTSRQYNALKFQLDGKVKSVIEARNFQIEQLKGKIKEIESMIKRKEKQKETVFKKLQSISPCHDSFKEIVKKYRNIKFFLQQKKRKLRNVTQKLERLLVYKKEKRIPICFGSKALFYKQFHLEENHLKNHAEWKKQW